MRQNITIEGLAAIFWAALNKAAKMNNVLCCLVLAILLSAMPVSGFAVGSSNNSASNTLDYSDELIIPFLTDNIPVTIASRDEPKEIKFKGTLKEKNCIMGFSAYYFNADEVLEGSIPEDDEIRVMVYCSAYPPLDNYDVLEAGDKAEIYAIQIGDSKEYDGWVGREVWGAGITSSAEYYVKKLRFQIGMFINPGEPGVNITTELLTKLQDNGVMRIFVNTYEARIENEEHVFYPKNGTLDPEDFLETKGVYNLSTLLTEAHDLNIEVHVCVACFGPDPVDPTGGNQQKNLTKVVKYLLNNYPDKNGKGIDGIHLDFVRFVKPYDAMGDASNMSIMSAFIKNLKEQVVEDRVKLSASVFAADHHGEDDCPTDRDHCWAGAYDSVKNNLSQDYTKMSENLDFISPMAYHYSKYYNTDPDYVGNVAKFVKEKIDDGCDVIPDIQGYYVIKHNKSTEKWCLPAESYCDGFKCDLKNDCKNYCIQEEPGFIAIYNALNSAKRNGAKGANIFRYIHLSDDEWLAIWCYLDDHDQLVSASIECPADLHAYDSLGRHVGMNELGDIDLEIPGAFYTGPDSEPERIIIPDQSDSIIFKVEALDSGEFNFTLTQSTETKTTTVTYLDVPIFETTEATVDLSEANPTYTMEIDKYGDGTTIETKTPDSIETDGQPSIPLYIGWNLISIPMMPDDSDVLDVMNSVDGNWNSVWSYEDGTWKRYDLTGPGFLNDLTTIEPGKGYWINMKSDDTLSVSGSEPTVRSIPLVSGWNLVGYNSLTRMSTTDAMSLIDGNWNSVWSYEYGTWKRYDLTGPDFLNDLTTMGHGKGYWIDMKSPDTWTLGD